MKYFHFLLVIVQLLLLKVRIAPAQESGEIAGAQSNYQLIVMRFQIYMDYYLMRDDIKKLTEEAQRMADSNDYETALVLMEEALALLIDDRESSAYLEPNLGMDKPVSRPPDQNFRFGIISGLDFNRQEFEVGFLTSDSVIAEEFNKPYFGLTAAFLHRYSNQGLFELSNTFRYDKDNLRDDYRIRWQPVANAYLQYSGYFNQGREKSTLSYWEHGLNARVNDQIGNHFNWTVYDFFNYKQYTAGNFTIGDFYRNRFSMLAEWRIPGLGISGMEYGNELNESLGQENNDYHQHNIRLGNRSDQNGRFFYSLYLDGILRQYAILLADSTINNSYRAFSVEFANEIVVWPAGRVVFEENFFYKTYQKKSTVEPDYIWNLLRPGLKFALSGQMELSMGYEWEIKKHRTDPGDSYNVSEQNFNADGLFGQLNFFSAGGTYLSATVSYQWRRYPPSLTNNIISIYSNRNIFSAMLLAYIPVSQHLTLNTFFTYDNDQDIDYDQQNNQSTIFTLELEYIF